ncbi:unnamed protein product [Phaeothamnion confervicola]
MSFPPAPPSPPPCCPICKEGPDANASCPLQPDWGDEHRMGYLMSAGLDPSTDADKLAFWSAAVKHYCEQATEISIDLDRLRRTLSRNGNTALGLEGALQAMATRGEMLPRRKVLLSETPSTWSGWLLNVLVVRPARAAFASVRLSSEGSAPPLDGAEPYVFRDVLEDLAACVAEYCSAAEDDSQMLVLTADPSAATAIARNGAASSSAASGSRSVRTFLTRVGEAVGSSSTSNAVRAPAAGERHSAAAAHLRSISEADAGALAAYMVATRRAARAGRVVKFGGRAAGAAATSAAVKAGLQISEADQHMLFLRCTVDKLRTEAERLQAQADAAAADALREKRTGHAAMALLHMRRRKRANDLLMLRLDCLTNLEHCLEKVEGMRVDKQVLEAQELAARAMRAFREQHHLTAERVDDAIFDMAEELEAADAFGTALGDAGRAAEERAGIFAGGGAREVDDALAAELVALEAEVAAERPVAAMGATAAVTVVAAARTATAASVAEAAAAAETAETAETQTAVAIEWAAVPEQIQTAEVPASAGAPATPAVPGPFTAGLAAGSGRPLVDLTGQEGLAAPSASRAAARAMGLNRVALPV